MSVGAEASQAPPHLNQSISSCQENPGTGESKLLAGSPGKVLTYVDLEATLPVDPESLERHTHRPPTPLWSLTPPSPTLTLLPPATPKLPHGSSWTRQLKPAARGLCCPSLESFPQLSASRCYSVFSVRAPLTPALCLPGWCSAPSNTPGHPFTLSVA